MIISLIAAMDENQLIGSNNNLHWHLPADMKFFKETTSGHHVLTGRKNYESIPEKFRPLKDRVNLIVSRSKLNYPGAQVFSTIADAIDFAHQSGEKELFIIGGCEIFKQTLSLADRIYITLIHHVFEGDVFFPEIDWRNWNIQSKIFHQADEKNKFDFSIIKAHKK